MKSTLINLFVILFGFQTLDGTFAGSCDERQICDEKKQLDAEHIAKFESEISTWESLRSSLSPDCWNETTFDWHTGFVIDVKKNTSDENVISNKMKLSQLWLLTECIDQTLIFLYFKGDLARANFSNHNFENSTTLQSETSNEFNSTTRQDVNDVMELMLKFFYSWNIYGPSHAPGSPITSVELWNHKPNVKCIVTKGQLLLRERDDVIDPDPSTRNRNLTRHSHHGGVSDAILTLICAVCGGSTLTFLLLFRRVRHCLCNICSICKDGERLLSNVDV